ncbi:DoxX family protein [Segetibacter sp. 3557_3]|uniref:DoxX family protein n=1 Tax=Segetibacter sp. 3557_3 TaxID=2547429 RepID=UPI001058A2B1|nr:DoxX family protein [Segetibacter sp. 3557_3]TDH21257.1 DoxX family protein [Segetibacter sp. 3557_3]
MKSLFRYSSLNTDVATLLLRLIFGGMFVHYGYGKIIGYDQILPMFGDIIGIGSKLSLILVIFAEFFCGLLIVLGLLTRLAVIPVFITMIVAYFIAHANDPFDVKQLAFIFLLLCLPVFILGSGRYSLDYLFGKKKSHQISPGAGALHRAVN